MKNILLKLLFAFNIFFIFNISDIDSDSNKKIIYSLNDLYDKKYYTVYFRNFNSNDLKYFNDLDIINYIINDKKYYVHDINELISLYTKNKSKEKEIYYLINGIRIDGITILGDVNDINLIEKITKIY